MKTFRCLKDFPQEIINHIEDEQETQGNPRNASIVDENSWNTRIDGGFTWSDTKEGIEFWSEVIDSRNFDLYFSKYPKQSKHSKNILDEANKIINERSEEQERNYGPISESIGLAAQMYELMTGQTMKTEHFFIAMVALKLSREAYSHREDNLLDAVAYLGALNNYYNEK